MPAKGDGITKRKDGLYMARYTVQTPDGPKRKTIYGRAYKEVEAELAKARGDAARGIVYDDKNLTVGEYLDRWLRDAVRGTVRESTYSRDEWLATNHAKPSIGRVKLKNLNAMHLQGLYRDRLDSGLSGSTVQKLHHVMHKALARAVRWDLIPRNPADAVEAPKPSKKEMRPLSADEAKRLLEVASGDRLEALYVLAVHTGMRSGELLGLKWSDVDLDAGTIRVRRTLTRKDNGRRIALGEPKTKKSRRTVKLTQRPQKPSGATARGRPGRSSRPAPCTPTRGSCSPARLGASSTPPTCASGRSCRSWGARGWRARVSPSTTCATRAPRSCSSATSTRSSSRSFWGTPLLPSPSTPTRTCSPAWAARPPTPWEKRWVSFLLSIGGSGQLQLL